MKRFIIVIVVMMALAFQTNAEESKSNSSSQPTKIELQQYSEPDDRHRAPMRVSIEAYFNQESNTIDIIYNGEAEGEVFLYLNNDIVGYDSNLNTSIQLPASIGRYRLEILGETWCVIGYLQI